MCVGVFRDGIFPREIWFLLGIPNKNRVVSFHVWLNFLQEKLINELER